MNKSQTGWILVLWFIAGFAFLIVPQILGRFNGADDPSLVSFYEVGNNARYLTHTEAKVVKSIFVAFAIVTIMLVLSLMRLYRKSKTVQPLSPGDVAKSAAPEK